MSAIVIAAVLGLIAGGWLGLLPYMLLRYRRCDLFGHGIYVTNYVVTRMQRKSRR